MNVSLNKIEFTLTTLLHELQRFQNLIMGKGKEVETNVATTKKEFIGGSSPKTKVGPSQMKKKERGILPRIVRERKLLKVNVTTATRMGIGQGIVQSTLLRRKHKVNMVY
ncbi:gag/pol protein [Cucumis melo var. makuwa]|uniref:Gag/pol protein n=1 Tax=Cucumis melo var. makuwa TaxID=1194695 RepID=A0A5A7U0X9_CUCMM|nr:gag/pol protein [Cucumis melo var. makuwa]